MSERRNQSTGIVRNLFSEQLRNLLVIGTRYRRRKQQEEKLDVSVELLIDHTDGKLRIITDYKKQLRSCVQAQIQFVHQQANKLFSPIDVTTVDFNQHELLQGLFYSKQEMQGFFQKSRKLTAAINDKKLNKHKPVYALVKIYKQEKTVFIPSLVNDKVINNVRQTQLDFSKKSVVSFTQQEDQHKDLIIAHLHLALIDHMKTKLVPTLAAAKGKACLIAAKDADNPNIYLSHLKSLMLSPTKIITLTEHQVSTNRFGIEVNEGNSENVDLERQMTFKQLQVADEQPYLLLPMVLSLD